MLTAKNPRKKGPFRREIYEFSVPTISKFTETITESIREVN